MPRRNRRRTPRRHMDPPEVAPRSYQQLAGDLVRRGLASPHILGSRASTAPPIRTNERTTR